ncbi:MAG: 30S ribosomal protein S6e [Candidatus Hodarchaeales archaeon]|jgi:small subunit ribosomal protein S6e
MANFQLNIAEPTTGNTFKINIEDDVKIRTLIGKKLKEELEGDPLGFEGYTFLITGGSDTDGFPMNPSVQGGFRKKILSAGGIGFKPKNKGLRKRRTVRGNTISEDTYQINLKVLKQGSKKIEELLVELKEED